MMTIYRYITGYFSPSNGEAYIMTWLVTQCRKQSSSSLTTGRRFKSPGDSYVSVSVDVIVVYGDWDHDYLSTFHRCCVVMRHDLLWTKSPRENGVIVPLKQ